MLCRTTSSIHAPASAHSSLVWPLSCQCRLEHVQRLLMLAKAAVLAYVCNRLVYNTSSRASRAWVAGGNGPTVFW